MVQTALPDAAALTAPDRDRPALQDGDMQYDNENEKKSMAALDRTAGNGAI